MNELPRKNYKYFEQRDFRGGINTEPENAFANQVLDARNMWCPEGRLVQRPGFKSIATALGAISSTALADEVVVREDTSAGTFSDSGVLSVLELGDRWYYGTSTDPSSDNFVQMTIDVTASNTASVFQKLEYWNGSSWMYIPHAEFTTVLAGDLQSTALGIVTNTYAFVFPFPEDWAQTTVNSNQRYFVRFSLFNDGFDTDGSVTVTASGSFYSPYLAAAYNDLVTVKGVFEIQFSSEKVFLTVGTPSGAGRLGIVYGHSFSHVSHIYASNTAIPTAEKREPSTLATVPGFDESFLMYENAVYVFTPSTTSTTLATVENDESLTGSGADFSTDRIAQLNAFPQARYIYFFHGQLWCAGLLNEPFTIRWSAPIPAHKVWPEVSFEILMEDDNSPITGISSLGEHLIVFKRDSVWRMVFNGQEADTGLNSYTPVKDWSGVGCVSNASIARTPDGLIFLSEDGVYLYNGTPNIRKLSGDIDSIIERVNPGMSSSAVGTHWSTKNTYLLSVAIDDSYVNNIVLVYDYKHKHETKDNNWVGAWWIWNGLNISAFCVAEDTSDKEVLYFSDSKFRINKFSGNTDFNQAISSYVVPQRMGFGEPTHKRARELRVSADNNVSSLDVQVVGQDKDFASSGDSMSFTDPTGIESSIDSFTFSSTAFGSRQRRESRLMFREDGDWFKVKIENSNVNQPMNINRISLGVIPMGRR